MIKRQSADLYRKMACPITTERVTLRGYEESYAYVPCRIEKAFNSQKNRLVGITSTKTWNCIVIELQEMSSTHGQS
jgi:hypothetical protein